MEFFRSGLEGGYGSFSSSMDKLIKKEKKKKQFNLYIDINKHLRNTEAIIVE